MGQQDVAQMAKKQNENESGQASWGRDLGKHGGPATHSLYARTPTKRGRYIVGTFPQASPTRKSKQKCWKKRKKKKTTQKVRLTLSAALPVKEPRPLCSTAPVWSITDCSVEVVSLLVLEDIVVFS